MKLITKVKNQMAIPNEHVHFPFLTKMIVLVGNLGSKVYQTITKHPVEADQPHFVLLKIALLHGSETQKSSQNNLRNQYLLAGPKILIISQPEKKNMKKRNLVSTFVRKQMTTVFFFSLNSDSADDYNNERKLGLENFVKTSLAKKKNYN